MEVILASRWAVQGPVNALYNLGKHGIESQYHSRRRDGGHNRYLELRNSGIPNEALLVNYNQFQNLHAKEQAAIEAFVLGRKPLPAGRFARQGWHGGILGVPPTLAEAQANGLTTDMAAARPVANALGIRRREVLRVLVSAYNAYTPLPQEQKDRVDAFLLYNRNVPKGAFVHGSEDYNRMTAKQRHTMDQILRMRQPGTKEHDQLYKHNQKAWKIVDADIKRKESIQDAWRLLGKSVCEGIKILPIPGSSIVRRAIKDWVDSRTDYHSTFNPDRKAEGIQVLISNPREHCTFESQLAALPLCTD